ncbi:metallophosphoesterase [Dechloromonas sp. ARDL1]|uniref:metallophosphoesterase family protein n=1 Tax=Dechloromonas sp. ARDL1 TaxID=3322121 RepID=UPI003DA75F40
MATLTILHLSDLHISEQLFADQKVILDALFKDIEAEKNKGVAYDLVVFSGDLIAKGSYTDANRNLAENEFFAPLLKAASIKNDRLFMVPGNHDLETNKIPSTLNRLLKYRPATADGGMERSRFS